MFHGSGYVRNIIPARRHGRLESSYDVIIRLDEYVEYRVRNKSKVLSNRPDLLRIVDGAKKRLDRFRPFALMHPFLNGLYARMSVLEGRNRLDSIGYLGNLDFGRETEIHLCVKHTEYPCVSDMVGGQGVKYITVHDGTDNNNTHVKGTATKCWPIGHWAEFVRLFKESYPEIRVVQIGGSHEQAYSGC